MSGKKNRAPRGDDEADSLTAQLSQNPQLLAALQAQLGGMVGGSSGYVETLPPEVHKRVSALRRLQLEHAKLDSAYFKEVRELEIKYAASKQPLFNKRAEIVSGAYEPTEEEAKPMDPEEAEELPPASDKPVTGVPHFWLTVLHADGEIDSIIEDYDDPILAHLQDVRVEEFSEPKIGYRLIFVFSKNEYFKNETLTKTYFMDYEHEENQVDFSGPSYDSAEGCEIDWNDDKNVTVKIEKKKQKKKGGKDAGKTRVVTKTVPQPSFFNFFKPPQLPEKEDEEGGDDDDAETQEALLSQDFQIGDRLRDHIVPNAVLFFTGEIAGDDDDEGDFGEDDYGEDGDEEEDEDDDEEEAAPPPKSGKGGKGGKPAAGPGGAPAQNPECKQQ